MAAPLEGRLLDWCTLNNGSNVVVITSALHAVGRRFEPGIQYDSLFFAPRASIRHGRRTLIFTRASRGAAARPARSCAVVNFSYIQTPLLLLGHARRHGQREGGGGREGRREVEVEAVRRHLGELEHDARFFGASSRVRRRL